MGQLIEHAFDDKAVAGFADAAPIADQQTAGRLAAHETDAMIGPFVRAGGVVHDVEVDAVLREGRQEPGHDGRADDMMLETDRHARIVDADPNCAVIVIAEGVVAEILLAAPGDLDRARDLACDLGRQHDPFGLQPPAEAAADMVVMDGDRILRQPEGGGDLPARASGALAADPDLAGIRPTVDCAIQRLHRRMRQHRHAEGKFVNLLRFGHRCRGVAARRSRPVRPLSFRHRGRRRDRRCSRSPARRRPIGATGPPGPCGRRPCCSPPRPGLADVSPPG